MHRFCLIAAVLLLVGCTAGASGPDSQNQMTQYAAEYCRSIGGENELRESRLGTGRYCRLPDGRVENEWQLYRSERLDNR
ncbi:MAG: hypothetical protein XD36_0008 [Halomonas sp. 54_146]|nr:MULTISPECIES: DUF333 domain-containing protein [unclassified Halomonas]KUJ89385.1 MAG: hypothetical protein XD36_0008 [Halomonas sp. 54_146]HAA46089.1 hypothetical protein [Halomonas sp.]